LAGTIKRILARLELRKELTMTLRSLFLATAAFLLPAVAYAADVPLRPKALAATPVVGYPVGSGFYWGLTTFADAGPVKGTIEGVGPASLTTNQIALAGTIGWTWNAGGPAFYAIEGSFGITNFNGGNTVGLSLSGPAAFEQRFKAGVPLAQLLSYFPTLNLPTVPPFPPLPNGQVATSVLTYLWGGVHEDDISANFGLATNREWSIAPALGVGMIGQLANGFAADAWVGTVFPAKGIAFGPVGATAMVGLSQRYEVGFSILY
jgi:hypothetical protein